MPTGCGPTCNSEENQFIKSSIDRGVGRGGLSPWLKQEELATAAEIEAMLVLLRMAGQW